MGSNTGRAGTVGSGATVVGGAAVVVVVVGAAVVGSVVDVVATVVVVDGVELVVVVARGAVVVVGRASACVAGVDSGLLSVVATVSPATVALGLMLVLPFGVDGAVAGPLSLLVSVHALTTVSPPSMNAIAARLTNMRRG